MRVVTTDSVLKYTLIKLMGSTHIQTEGPVNIILCLTEFQKSEF
jgi:hypothetical protein